MPSNPTNVASAPPPNTEVASAPTSVAPRSGIGEGNRDAYGHLLATSRGMRRDHSIARDSWVATLVVDRKLDELFELETLLKGLACWSAPRNQPGPAREGALSAHDFHAATQLARDGVTRARKLARSLVNQPDRALVVQRHVEHVAPKDTSRVRFVRPTASDETPTDALVSLGQGLAYVGEVLDALLALDRVPFRALHSALELLHREVTRSSFFDSTLALEFRPEFDRIGHPSVLAAIRRVGNEEAQPLFALTFLTIFRSFRYLEAAEAAATTAAPQLAYLQLAACRSDCRALVRHLLRDGRSQLAKGYDREIFAASARLLGDRYDELVIEGERMRGYAIALETAAVRLRVEVTRCFHRELPALGEETRAEDLRAAIARASRTLRPALSSLVAYLMHAIGGHLEPGALFEDQGAKRAIAEHARRDVWMFAQILRGFVAKANVSKAPERGERWTHGESFRFVREFMDYFKALGVTSIPASDYPRLDKLNAALGAVVDTDLLDTSRLTTAIAECEAFHVFLLDRFEALGAQPPLAGRPFDKRAAIEALKGYLADAKR